MRRGETSTPPTGDIVTAASVVTIHLVRIAAVALSWPDAFDAARRRTTGENIMTCLAPADQLAATTFLLVSRLMKRLVESGALTQEAALDICDDLANEKISKSGNDYQRKQLLNCLRSDLEQRAH
jgi:polyhydroxyalkanoate synthesis regulator phasin